MVVVDAPLATHREGVQHSSTSDLSLFWFSPFAIEIPLQLFLVPVIYMVEGMEDAGTVIQLRTSWYLN